MKGDKPSQSQKPCVVFFATQSGATHESFNRERCYVDVIVPARELLESGLVRGVVFVIECEKDAPGSEVPEMIYDKDQVRMTPSAKFILENLRKHGHISEVPNYCVDVLDIDVWKNLPHTRFGHIVGFAKEQGDAVLYFAENQPFPSLGAVMREIVSLREGEVRVIDPPIRAAA